MFPKRKAQSGFSLIMGVFLIVVLAGIAVFLGRVATMQYHESALDEEGAMAYQGAKAGVEWAAYQAIRNNSCAVGPAILTFPPGSELVRLNYTVTVICSSTSPAPIEGNAAVSVYQIVSTAHNGSGGNFRVERQLQAVVAR